MDEQLIKLFCFQIWTQGMFVLIAYEDLGVQLADRSIAQQRARPSYDELFGLEHEAMTIRAMEISMAWPNRTWFPIQALLTATANISKALWGDGAKFAVERAPLRSVLEIEDSSPIKPTAMRNNFDHFDERLTDWWGKSQSHNYVDLSFGNVAGSIQGIPVEDMFRSYDPGTGDLVFWGQRYNIPTIIAEVERIMPAAIGEASK